jgi:hypothetical protein
VDANLGRNEPRERGRMSLLFDKLNLSSAGSVAASPASRAFALHRWSQRVLVAMARARARPMQS